MRARLVAAGLLVLLFCTGAGSPEDALKNPQQEARARSLFREIRCLICQNESIDDSEALIAGDLRKIVRQEVVAGKSDGEIKKFLTDRYGEFVLLKPSFGLGNAILWVTPFAIVGLGAAGLIFVSRRKVSPETPPLDEEEQKRLAAALEGKL